jgi:hypothetical protein
MPKVTRWRRPIEWTRFSRHDRLVLAVTEGLALLPDSYLLRSRPLYNRGESGGLGGNWVDRTAGQGTGENPVDEYCHLAKVRVAGSNPVFRSK